MSLRPSLELLCMGRMQKIAPKLKKDEVIIVNNCGSGAKDAGIIKSKIDIIQNENEIDKAFEITKKEKRPH